MLTKLEKDLEAQLREKFGWIAQRGVDARVTSHSQRRLEANLLETKSLIREVYRKLGRQIRGDLRDLAGLEARFVARATDQVFAAIGLDAPGMGIASGELLTAIVDRRPMQGHLLREWTAKLNADTYTAVSDALRTWMAGNETIDQIVRRVIGTKEQPGVLRGAPRRDVEAVVRTAHAHVANAARLEGYKEQKDLIRGLRWDSVFDSRTTPQCRIRNGKLYTLEGKPIGHSVPSLGFPPIHWRCRSNMRAEFLPWHGLPMKIEPGMRAAFGGPVRADMSYGDWLLTQDDVFVARAVGAKRARLLRAGKLRYEDLHDDSGNYFTIEQIDKWEAA